ncbi:NADPH-dependent F420 reductase [Streptomyces fuscichromogenes]|uniref:NADP oxidoreductase n=1 Tax=Streptomyces fuscichromogenes TaxID=1324013 RepID=A0A917XFX5_9ACTN|nr:NAD(P)-binding domain-containing protein [Streptomyces fuscichromogenes]GGN21113.1 NADP oxidoreductase [Streptomyces fuscichromogenes]
MRVFIVGTGNMAGAIATRALAGGHLVRLIGTDPVKAAALADALSERTPGADVAPAVPDAVGSADVVVLAVPFDRARQVVTEYGDQLTGKTVVDISNPVDFSTFDSLTVPADSSAAQQLAEAAAPGTHLVKAFNTTFAGSLVAGEVGGLPLDVFIAGDDAAARDQVAELVSSGGLNPVVVGALRHARELEGIQLLHMALQTRPEGHGWMSAIKIVAP